MAVSLSPFSASTNVDPYGYYQALVAQRPFYWDQDISAWVASNAHWVRWALNEPVLGVRPADEPVPKAFGDTVLADLFGRLARMNDGDRHGHRRAMVAASSEIFHPDHVSSVAGNVARELTQEVRRGQASLTSYCYDVPLRSMAALMGMTEEEQVKACQFIPSVVAAIAPGASGGAIELGVSATTELLTLARRLFDAPSRGPFIESIGRHVGADAEVDFMDACANAVGILIQTYESTAGLVGNTLLALRRHDEWLTPFMQDAFVSAQVVAEVLRWDPPIHNTRRFAHAHLVVDSKDIAKGDLIVVLLAASNRDPCGAKNPNNFDPLRAGASNTLGQGRHACVGGTLASLIAQRAVHALIDGGFQLDNIEEPIHFRPVKNARVPELQTRTTNF
jgi:cytochrome P450